MTEFSHETLALLKSAGWDENYRCNVTGFVNPYDFECRPPSQAVVDFMERFGGLKIGVLPDRHFNRAFPIDFLEQAECDNYSHFAERLDFEVPLIAYRIGISHSGHIDLFMTKNGQVYGHFDAELWKFGDSGTEAIENLCHDRLIQAYQ
jgi:hypothetical protein